VFDADSGNEKSYSYSPLDFIMFLYLLLASFVNALLLHLLINHPCVHNADVAILFGEVFHFLLASKLQAIHFILREFCLQILAIFKSKAIK
jgi:hypothetical protein